MLSAAAYAASPRTYLESDRGVYLRNTLNMARYRPFGVGLGDWQSQYPVFRSVRRSADFTDQGLEVQVRRAHSDHVQFLGEAGWPGFVLWLAYGISIQNVPLMITNTVSAVVSTAAIVVVHRFGRA